MTKAERQVLRELLAKATPGEWETDAQHIYAKEGGCIAEYYMPAGKDAGIDGFINIHNARLSVAARNALPALLDALDAYEELLPLVRDALYDSDYNSNRDLAVKVDEALERYSGPSR